MTLPDDLTPAGFKGGQGRSGPAIEGSTWICAVGLVGIIVVLILAKLGVFC